jgi:hypothetical protein
LLAALIAVLSAVVCLVGLFWQDGDDGARAISVRGEEVKLYGEGLYRFDTVFIAAGSRGTDVVTLLLGLPLLVVGVALYRRGSMRGALVLAGAVAYFLYVYASRSLGNAYNGLFLAYIALFSASLFALLMVVVSVDHRELGAQLGADRPRRGLAGFLLASGVVTAAVWLMPLLGSVAGSDAPKYLDTYTATVTDVLDLGVIVPILLIAGILILGRNAMGYVLAVVMIVLLLLVAATIIVGTAFQVVTDVSFTTGEIVGPIAGFIILGAIGMVLLARLLRDVGEREGERRRQSPMAAGPPPAETAYSTALPESGNGIFFESTPGPGDSEGGDVFAPAREAP